MQQLGRMVAGKRGYARVADTELTPWLAGGATEVPGEGTTSIAVVGAKCRSAVRASARTLLQLVPLSPVRIWPAPCGPLPHQHRTVVANTHSATCPRARSCRGHEFA